ncbi:MAG TPA: chromosome segregation protein SMC [Anaerolineales bacterium]|nr:chromosome segregation protein SMC [Anaerolineales bacterium]
MPARLKSLELHGYKTFASRTEFIFADGVTAVVGPNGSGKSNIADAIRWVLGEQTYSLLRGKKTEDMIFSGSELRPRAGMASATIVFDNSDGWLPIDFTEVGITRRAYRDGDNEYLLNGQRVRLKDVSELLAQSGLAERTYTIIGQGLVDASLMLKAEERRRLFEEAAGIGLHRSRREESLRRLDTTRRNLERVQDILAELQPRLRSLERQARRAQEYEQVRADLRLILREWYGYHWHHAQEALTDAREAARRQEEILEKAKESQADFDSRLSTYRTKIQALRERLGEWHRQLAELHSRRDVLTREQAVAEERGRALATQKQEASAEMTRLEDELKLSDERLATAGLDLKQLEGELSEAQARVEETRKSLQQRQAERLRAEKALQSARQTLSGLTAQQAHLQARLSERQSQAARQREALQSLLATLEGLERDVATAEGKAESVAKQLAEVEQARQVAESALQAQQQKIRDFEAQRKEMLDQRSARQANLAQLKARLDVLEQAESNLSGYAEGARKLLQAAREARLSGSLGALSNHIQVPAELETAIAAALGEYVDAVILEQASSSDAALEILLKDATRGALLPLDVLASPRSFKIEADKAPGGSDAVMGVAAGLVTCSDELRPVLDLLLGQVVIVRERDAARRILASGDWRNWPNFRVVTLRGELFYASGQVLTGAPGRGVLSRPRQLRELKDALEQGAGEIRVLDEKLVLQNTDLDSKRREEVKLRQEVEQGRQAERASRAARDQAELGADKARRALQWQREQRGRQEGEIAQGVEEEKRIAAGLKKLEDEVRQARENLREKSGDLEALSLDELQTQLGHWNTRTAVSERAVADARNRQQERRSGLERIQRTLAQLKTRLADFEGEAVRLDDQRNLLKQEEAVVIEQVSDMQTLTQPAEEELASLEQAQNQVLSTDTEARQALSLAEHHHSQAKINLARRQEALESLRRRIEDDFGLVSFDYADSVSGPKPLPLQGMVEELPKIKELPPDLEETLQRQRTQLHRMGAVNPEAQTEYQQVQERYQFLTSQVADLQKAEQDIKEVIAELDLLMEREFRKTFDAVAQEFRQIFTRLFGGGSARLVLTDPEDLTETGIDIEARLPGRREQGLSLLSGGERSLTAAALVFALLRISPTPFCVLDEVDAMLDEANVGRFRDMLTELSQQTQFIVVTHNRNTVQTAGVIYGVTMGRDSASQVISLRLDQVSEEYGV